jgi:hypothetical protein
MGKLRKLVFFIVMGLLELVFLSWVFASNLPRRSADLNAFARYQKAPTKENEDLWLKERQKTQNEVILRKSVGICLASGNLILIVWVARRWKRPVQSSHTTRSPEASVDV